MNVFRILRRPLALFALAGAFLLATARPMEAATMAAASRRRRLRRTVTGPPTTHDPPPRSSSSLPTAI